SRAAPGPAAAWRAGTDPRNRRCSPAWRERQASACCLRSAGFRACAASCARETKAVKSKYSTKQLIAIILAGTWQMENNHNLETTPQPIDAPKRRGWAWLAWLVIGLLVAFSVWRRSQPEPKTAEDERLGNLVF